MSVLGQAEPGRGLPAHSSTLRRSHSHQTVLQGAAGAFVSPRVPRSFAQSPGTAVPRGPGISPAAAVLSAPCQKLLLPALPVWLPLQSLPEVWHQKPDSSLHSTLKGSPLHLSDYFIQMHRQLDDQLQPGHSLRSVSFTNSKRNGDVWNQALSAGSSRKIFHWQLPLFR